MRAEYLTLKEMATMMRASTNTVRNLARGYYQNSRGARAYVGRPFIPIVKVGGKLLGKKADFERWLASR